MSPVGDLPPNCLYWDAQDTRVAIFQVQSCPLIYLPNRWAPICRLPRRSERPLSLQACRCQDASDFSFSQSKLENISIRDVPAIKSDAMLTNTSRGRRPRYLTMSYCITATCFSKGSLGSLFHHRRLKDCVVPYSDCVRALSWLRSQYRVACAYTYRLSVLSLTLLLISFISL
jgi:hypothetical protein